MKYLSRQSGFTLLELLLYVGISSIIILSVSGLVQLIFEARIKAQTVTEVEQQGQQVVQLLSQTTRNATGLTTPASGATSVTMTATVPTGALSPTVVDLSGGAIRIKEGAGAAVNLTNSKVTASGLSFKDFGSATGASSVQFKFTLSYNNVSGKNEYSYTKNFEAAATLRCATTC